MPDIICSVFGTVAAFIQVLFSSCICIAPSAHTFVIHPRKNAANVKCGRCGMPLFLYLSGMTIYSDLADNQRTLPQIHQPTPQCNATNSASGAHHLLLLLRDTCYTMRSAIKTKCLLTTTCLLPSECAKRKISPRT